MKIFLIISFLGLNFAYATQPEAERRNDLNHTAEYENLKRQKHEAMAVKYAPLGGVWVDLSKVSDKVSDIHLGMISAEKEFTTKTAERFPTRVSTNFATFILSCVVDSSVIDLLIPNEEFFSSEPRMILRNGTTQETILVCNFEDEIDKKYTSDSPDIKKINSELQTNLSCQKATVEKLRDRSDNQILKKFIKDQERGRKLSEDFLAATKQEEERQNEKNETRVSYAREYFNIFEKVATTKIQNESNTSSATAAAASSSSSHNETAYEKLMRDYERYYRGYENHVHDTEQLITKIVNAYMENLASNNVISLDGKKIETSKIKYFMLNMHTRFDMCPFCLMYLAGHVQKWEKLLQEKELGVPFLAIVSSRQDYLCNDTFIQENAKKYNYTGLSMKDIGKWIYNISMNSTSSSNASAAAAAASSNDADTEANRLFEILDNISRAEDGKRLVIQCDFASRLRLAEGTAELQQANALWKSFSKFRKKNQDEQISPTDEPLGISF